MKKHFLLFLILFCIISLQAYSQSKSSIGIYSSIQLSAYPQMNYPDKYPGLSEGIRFDEKIYRRMGLEICLAWDTWKRPYDFYLVPVNNWGDLVINNWHTALDKAVETALNVTYDLSVNTNAKWKVYSITGFSFVVPYWHGEIPYDPWNGKREVENISLGIPKYPIYNLNLGFDIRHTFFHKYVLNFGPQLQWTKIYYDATLWGKEWYQFGIHASFSRILN